MYRVPPISTEEWQENKESTCKKTGLCNNSGRLSERDKFDLDCIPDICQFSYATAVMDRIGGWEKEMDKRTV